MFGRSGLLMVVGALVCVSTAVAQPTVEIASEVIATGFDTPVDITSAPQDEEHLYIVEQYTGDVRVLNLVTGEVDAQPFVTVPNLGTGIEGGLKNLVFDPNYEETRRFYVAYTTADNVTHIARGTKYGTGRRLSLQPELEVILSLPQFTGIHHGGSMAFSPKDGYLYIGFGDGGGAADPSDRAQDLTKWHGKILRINVSVATGYAVPSDNPYVDDPNALDEIWASGLRNPWRFTFDRTKKDLIIADVGQSTREELNFQDDDSDGGENYGWKCYEGETIYHESVTNPCGSCDDPACPFEEPVFTYGPKDGRCIVGGIVYRGQAIGGLRGRYVFADFVSNRVWSAQVRNSGVTHLQERTAELTPEGGALVNIVAFGEDAGEVYMCSRTTGEIFKIVPLGEG